MNEKTKSKIGNNIIRDKECDLFEWACRIDNSKNKADYWKIVEGLIVKRHAWCEPNIEGERRRVCEKDHMTMQEERSKLISRGWAN